VLKDAACLLISNSCSLEGKGKVKKGETYLV
jgi:hypothetical protein